MTGTFIETTAAAMPLPPSLDEALEKIGGA